MTPQQQAAITAAAQDWAASSVPYVSGGWTKAGADCSGSVSAIYAQAGMPVGHLFSSSFPRDARFRAISGDPQVGDVGWYPGHVVIYAGPLARGMNVWSASRPGGPVFGAGSGSWYGRPNWYRYGAD